MSDRKEITANFCIAAAGLLQQEMEREISIPQSFRIRISNPYDPKYESIGFLVAFDSDVLNAMSIRVVAEIGKLPSGITHTYTWHVHNDFDEALNIFVAFAKRIMLDGVEGITTQNPEDFGDLLPYADDDEFEFED